MRPNKSSSLRTVIWIGIEVRPFGQEVEFAIREDRHARVVLDLPPVRVGGLTYLKSAKISVTDSPAISVLPSVLTSGVPMTNSAIFSGVTSSSVALMTARNLGDELEVDQRRPAMACLWLSLVISFASVSSGTLPM